MMRPEHLGDPLTEEDLSSLKNEGERIFALACLESGCELYYQVNVGNSNIDFFVVNPKIDPYGGKLVEVTLERREDIEKKYVKKGKKKKRQINTTGMRKKRQMESMEESGMEWTILYREELDNLIRNHQQ